MNIIYPNKVNILRRKDVNERLDGGIHYVVPNEVTGREITALHKLVVNGELPIMDLPKSPRLDHSHFNYWEFEHAAMGLRQLYITADKLVPSHFHSLYLTSAQSYIFEQRWQLAECLTAMNVLLASYWSEKLIPQSIDKYKQLKVFRHVYNKMTAELRTKGFIKQEHQITRDTFKFYSGKRAYEVKLDNFELLEQLLKMLTTYTIETCPWPQSMVDIFRDEVDVVMPLHTAPTDKEFLVYFDEPVAGRHYQTAFFKSGGMKIIGHHFTCDVPTAKGWLPIPGVHYYAD